MIIKHIRCREYERMWVKFDVIYMTITEKTCHKITPNICERSVNMPNCV